MRLRVALVHHAYADPPAPGAEQAVHAVAHALLSRGHTPVVLASHPQRSRTTREDGIEVRRVARLPEDALRRRGFTGPLTHSPLLLRALARGGFDLAHAFSAGDAAVALRWGAATGRPVVWSCTEVLDRSRVADARLRRRLLTEASGADAVVAHDEEARRALERWLMVEATVIAPGDGEALEALHRRLLERR